ncbi:unnamed protein product [Caenorhabditis brenneri]
MAPAPPFPLLSLPDAEILRTVRVMNLRQILRFSFVSQKCKDLVKSIQIKGTSIHVSIGNEIKISIGTASWQLSLYYYTEPDKYWGMGAYGRKKKLTTPQSVLIDVETAEDLMAPPSKWKKRDCTMKNWLQHLQQIFNYHKTNGICFNENSSEFDIDDIKELFGNITKVTIENTGCLAFNQSILQKFFAVEDLTIMAENFQNSKIPSSVLMQNHSTLYIARSDMDVTKITLDELLRINSKVITVESLQMSPKQLNQFIKLWQRGSNPRMERLWIQYENANEDDKEIVMRGIKHDVVPDNRRRMFKSVGMTDPYPVTYGIDIHRMDGVKATIQFDYEETFSIVEMFVWMDHCVVE